MAKIKLLFNLLICLSISTNVYSSYDTTEDFFKKLDVCNEKISERTISSQKKWTILVYIEANNNLSECAVGNINDMRNAPSSDNVNLIVQWSKPDARKTHRLKIENGKVYDVGSLNQDMGINPSKELLDSFSWIKDKYPAEQYMLILWNHGAGYLDKSKKGWLNPLCFEDNYFEEALPLEAQIEIAPIAKSDEKGILYNDEFHTYLSTEQMTKTLEDGMVTLEKPFDIVGMDACLMAMIEVAYAIRHSTNILVGSENLEQGAGWNYFDFITKLVASDGNLNPQELAESIVKTYQKQYLKTDRSFTQSSINLNLVPQIKDQINLLALEILHLKVLGKDSTLRMMENAISKCIRYGKEYADIYSFCEELSSQVNQSILFYQKHLDRQLCKEILQSLYKISFFLTSTKKAVKEAVLSNAAGVSIFASGGLSIYLPNIFTTKVNQSYLQSDFAKDCAWSQLLTTLTSDK